MLSPRPLWPVLLLAGCAILPAEEGRGWKDPLAGAPVLTTYGPSHYNSSDANWSVAVANDGRVYVGNSAVMRFDGRTWTRIPIPGTYAIRALETDASGRLWVGGIDELGYLTDPGGTPEFVSLRPKLDARTPIGAVWNVAHLGSRVVFVCEQRALIWDGAIFHVREMPTTRRLFSFRYRGGVVISQPGTGLWFTNGETFEPIDLGGAEKDEVGWGYDLPNGSGVFVTAKGLIQSTGRQSEPLGGDLDVFLRQGLATSATELPGGYSCIGTFRSGAVVIDRHGNICRVLDRAAGLPGQDIVGVAVGRDHLLCVVGRRFVAFLHSGLAITSFGPRNGMALAAPRLVVLGPQPRSFLVTDDAVLKIEPGPRGARLTPFSDGQFLDALSLPNGAVIFGGLRQIARWQPGAGLVGQRETNDVIAFASLGGGRFVAAVGNSLRIGRAGDRIEWEAAEARFAEPISDVIVRDSEVWAANERGKLFLLDARDLAPQRTYEAGRELPVSFASPRFLRVGSLWLVHGGQEFYDLAFAPPQRMADLSGLPVAVVERIGSDVNADTWAVTMESSSNVASLLRLTEDAGNVVAETYPLNGAASLGRPGFAQRDQSGALWVAGTGGILRLDPEALQNLLLNRPRLFTATLVTRQGTVQLPLQSAWTLPPDFLELKLDFRREPEPLALPVVVQSRLVGFDTAWQSSTGEREFSHLRAGTYRFDVRLPNETGSTTLATFVVAPPWYLRRWFIACAVVAGISAVWGLSHLRVKQVAARNKALTVLVESQTDELTKAVSAKTAFIAQLGHEIRNPLNGVVGLSSSLRNMPLGAKESDIAVRLASCAEQLASVVEDVLEFSLVEAGRVQLRRRTFDLLEPVRSAIFVFESASESRPQLKAINLGRNDQPRVGDPDRIRQILANYLENARKYAAGSEIVVSVTEEPDGRVVFCVADRGPGIPAAELPHIFERFSRGEEARCKGIPGTGLGLAACRAYATAMGGTVWATSDPGAGARFFLALNLPYAQPGEPPPQAVSREMLDGWIVFVVDDHDYNLFVLCDILAKMGAMTRPADSMASALRLFESAVPDLVLIDVDLGTDSGITLARRIRDSQFSARDVPIIATSGFELDDVREGCLKAGMNGFVSKPVTLEKISNAVRHINSLAGNAVVIAQDVPPASGRSNLELLSEGDPDLRDRVIAGARKTLVESIVALNLACEQRDLEAIRRHAHAITSAALTVDLARVASLARETERCARRGLIDAGVESAAVLLAAVKDADRLDARS